MIHLDLFSGIGGFAYAVDQLWDNVEHIFCDNDKFCRAVLTKHWPGSYIYDDIRHITDTDIQRLLERKSKIRPADWDKAQPGLAQRIDILTGGFPCQPFSAAGLRRGTDDDRHLWPEMLRVIQLTQPTWVIAENVRGLLTLQGGVVFEQVCLDLEASGYEVQPLIIPAVAVNAPHRRDRVWFIAHSRHGDGSGIADEGKSDGQVLSTENAPKSERPNSDAGKGDVTNTEAKRLQQRGKARGETTSGSARRRRFANHSSWNQDWLEVATRLCSVDDGLPSGLGDLTLTKAGHRKEQLKAYGNSIVPEVAMEIMRGMGNR